MRVFCHSDGFSGVDYWRTELPVKNLKVPGVELVLKQQFDTKHDYDYDAYYFNRVPAPAFFPVLYRLKSAGKILLLSIDDDVWHMQPSNPNKDLFGPITQMSLDLMLDWANAILVTNEHLRTEIKREAKTIVLPNLIDTTVYPEFSEPKSDDVLRVVWTGGATHMADLDQLTPVIRCLAGKNLKFIFVGGIGSELRAYKLPGVIFFPSMPLAMYQEMICVLRADVAVCPLEAHRFNQSKSNIKMLEMSMSGLPVVATDYGPYSGWPCSLVRPPGGDCWYNAGNTDEWISAIEAMTDVRCRREKLIACREVVLKDWSWLPGSSGLARWVEFFSELSKWRKL